MYHQLSQLENLMQVAVTGADSAALSNQAGQMRENIDFMKTLNDFFPYVQLPIKLKDSNIHSDLYVYTKKNELKNHPDNISVLLHLDMEHLGPLDIHLALANKHISSKFYVSDLESQQLIESHVIQLQTALIAKGYSLTYETLERKRDIDIVDDFIAQDSPSTSLKRYTFDIRA
jgi:flagellar hook-length control protein FliK